MLREAVALRSPALYEQPPPVTRPEVRDRGRVLLDASDFDGVEQTLYATRRGDTYVLHFTDATSGHTSSQFVNVNEPATAEDTTRGHRG